MERDEKKITDICCKGFAGIMRLLSNSSSGGGAKELLRISTVCKIFKERAEDPFVLQDVTFDDVQLSEIHESFWGPNGLLFRCIRAGNLKAFKIACDQRERLDAACQTTIYQYREARKEALAMSSSMVMTQAKDELCRLLDSLQECNMKRLTFEKELAKAVAYLCFAVAKQSMIGINFAAVVDEFNAMWK